jgi:photosystem II stability/assembly factor-like uncharacterized protein
MATPLAGQADAQRVTDALKALEWRPIGPANMGGRVTDIVGIPGDPLVFWVAGADAGLYKTVNGGTTFEAQFDDESVLSVGALTLAPSDHNVLWLGSGEGDPRNSVSYGNGVYRSTDGGDTWAHLGLDDTERIKRIAVHPDDPDVAYVCALGHEWGPNAERGVFRTTDGGATWQKVLYRDEDTGCSDLSMDMTNPRILYAGMWTFRRRPWRFDDGGRETALYKSRDGGNTWEKLTQGLPKGPMARIGVAVSWSEPNVVYMITEAKDEGTLFRSDDAGDSWRMVHDVPRINFRPFYYSDIRVDPNNPNVVYSLSGGLYKSIDGGETFESIGGGVHGDHQALWIDPANSDRVLSGSDGGYQVSNDAGENWDIINNVLLSQFYQIAYDYQRPYYVCGGLQDNGSWCGPSRTTHSGGILKDDWFRVSGGDGFYAIPIPDKPHLIYTDLQGGVFMLTNMRSGGTRRIHPYPNTVGSAGDAMAGHKYRFNWDSPIHISPHDPSVVYIGGNHVFKSSDYGHSWVELSPDLTTNDPAKQATSGGEVYQDNTAAEFHTTVLTIAESPVQAGVIWAGTDDGKVWVTEDGGDNWTDITRNIRGLPDVAWVAKIDASRFDAGTAYIAVDQHRMDDFTPHAYRVTNFGRNSSDLSRGLPEDDYVKVIREDTRNPGLLYVGMDRGVFASWDGGDTWISIRNNLPPASVRDIQVHPRENDLIIGTHGIGAWILDDIGPLQELAEAIREDVYLFGVRPAALWQSGSRDASFGQREFRAPNPPSGAYINYHLAEKPDEPVVITVKDRSGQVVRTLRNPNATAGVNRTVWNLRHEDPTPISTEEGGGPGGGGFGGFGRFGPAALPGEYTVAVRAAGKELEVSFQVEPDPRVDVSRADYQAQFAAGLTLRDLSSQVNLAIRACTELDRQLVELIHAVRAADEVENKQEIMTAAETALDEVRAFEATLRRPPPRMSYRQAPRLSEEIRSLTGSVGSVASRPTQAEMVRLAELEAQAAERLGALDQLIGTTINDLNQMIGSYPRILVER